MNRTTTISSLPILLLASASLLGGCAPADRSAVRAIPDILTRQAEDWNRGDVAAFMEPYWQSEQLSFSAGGRMTRGWQATLDNYRRRYPDQAAMGRLTFDQLEIQPLGDEAALVLGRWQLDRPPDNPGGLFSLVFQRIDGRWVIIHDHTSLTPDSGE